MRWPPSRRRIRDPQQRTRKDRHLAGLVIVHKRLTRRLFCSLNILHADLARKQPLLSDASKFCGRIALDLRSAGLPYFELQACVPAERKDGTYAGGRVELEAELKHGIRRSACARPVVGRSGSDRPRGQRHDQAEDEHDGHNC